MIRICVIGGIGSGKTFVSKLFRFPVFNADDEVRNIYKKNKECFKKLKQKLPSYIKSFPIKKTELTKAVIARKSNLKTISSIVHPLVRKKMKIFINKNKNTKYIVLDVPLILENKLNKKGDILIFVKTSPKKILNRLNKRSNFNKNIFRKLINNQMSLQKKIKLSNYIIENNFPPDTVKKKVILLKKKIMHERNCS